MLSLKLCSISYCWFAVACLVRNVVPAKSWLHLGRKRPVFQWQKNLPGQPDCRGKSMHSAISWKVKVSTGHETQYPVWHISLSTDTSKNYFHIKLKFGSTILLYVLYVRLSHFSAIITVLNARSRPGSGANSIVLVMALSLQTNTPPSSIIFWTIHSTGLHHVMAIRRCGWARFYVVSIAFS